MNTNLVVVLAAIILYGISAFVFTAKIVEGVNVQRIRRGKATMSRDEIRRLVRAIRFAISALIVCCKLWFFIMMI